MFIGSIVLPIVVQRLEVICFKIYVMINFNEMNQKDNNINIHF